MYKIYWNVFFLFLLVNLTNAQHLYKEVSSDFLDSDRRIKIQLPRSYDSSPKKEYPLFLVLDADYLFEPIGGMVDYLSYWDEIPEAIVVGILQKGHKSDDFNVGGANNLPQFEGQAFFDFLELELLTYIEKNYRTMPLRIIAGHGESANFSNFFLLKEDPLFQGYMNFSPFYSPEMIPRILNALEKLERKTWYYHGFSENEPAKPLQDMRAFAKEADSIANPNLVFIKDSLQNATHYTSVSQGVSNALEKLFSVYRPITPIEYKEKIIYEVSPVTYLEDKYFDIANYYSIDSPIRINDIMFVSKAIEEKEHWKEYKDLAKLAKKHQPETLLNAYFLGRYFQEIGNPKKAMQYYQEAYSYQPVGYLTKELMLQKVKEISTAFGY